MSNARTFGPAYDEALDGKRLHTQFKTILGFMLSGTWRTLAEISAKLGYPEGSISAQLRHAKKPEFGSYRLEKRRRAGKGTWEYRLLPPLPGEPGKQEMLFNTNGRPR